MWPPLEIKGSFAHQDAEPLQSSRSFTKASLRPADGGTDAESCPPVDFMSHYMK